MKYEPKLRPRGGTTGTTEIPDGPPSAQAARPCLFQRSTTGSSAWGGWRVPLSPREEGERLSVGCTGAAAGRGGGGSLDSLPRRCVQLTLPTSITISEEKPVGVGEVGRRPMRWFCKLAFLVPAQCHCHQVSQGGAPDTHGGVSARVRGRGLRAPETSARPAWQACKTAPGHLATSWKRPRWLRFRHWALKEKADIVHWSGLTWQDVHLI